MKNDNTDDITTAPSLDFELPDAPISDITDMSTTDSFEVDQPELDLDVSEDQGLRLTPDQQKAEIERLMGYTTLTKRLKLKAEDEKEIRNKWEKQYADKLKENPNAVIEEVAKLHATGVSHKRGGFNQKTIEEDAIRKIKGSTRKDEERPSPEDIESLLSKLPEDYKKAEEENFINLPEDREGRLKKYEEWRSSFLKMKLTDKEKQALELYAPDINKAVFGYKIDNAKDKIAEVTTKLPKASKAFPLVDILNAGKNTNKADEFISSMENDVLNSWNANGYEQKVNRVRRSGGLWHKDESDLISDYTKHYSGPNLALGYARDFLSGATLGLLSADEPKYKAYDRILQEEGTIENSSDNIGKEIANSIGGLIGTILLTEAGGFGALRFGTMIEKVKGLESSGKALKEFYSLLHASRRYSVDELMKSQKIASQFVTQWSAQSGSFAVADAVRKATSDWNNGKEIVAKEYGKVFAEDLLMGTPMLAKSWLLGWTTNLGIITALSIKDLREGHPEMFVGNLLVFTLFDAITRKFGGNHLGIDKDAMEFERLKMVKKIQKRDKITEAEAEAKADVIIGRFTKQLARDKSLSGNVSRISKIDSEHNTQFSKILEQITDNNINKGFTKDRRIAFKMAKEELSRNMREITFLKDLIISNPEKAKSMMFQISATHDIRPAKEGKFKNEDIIPTGANTSPEDAIIHSIQEEDYQKIGEAIEKRWKSLNEISIKIRQAERELGTSTDIIGLRSSARDLYREMRDAISAIIDKRVNIAPEFKRKIIENLIMVKTDDLFGRIKGIQVLRREDVDADFLAKYDLFVIAEKRKGLRKHQILELYEKFKRLPYKKVLKPQIFESPKGDIIVVTRKAFDEKTNSSPHDITTDIRETLGSENINSITHVDENYGAFLDSQDKIFNMIHALNKFSDWYATGEQELRLGSYNPKTMSPQAKWHERLRNERTEAHDLSNKAVIVDGIIKNHTITQSQMNDVLASFNVDELTSSLNMAIKNKDAILKSEKLINALSVSSSDKVRLGDYKSDTLEAVARSFENVKSTAKDMHDELIAKGDLPQASKQVFANSIVDYWKTYANTDPNMSKIFLKMAGVQLSKHMDFMDIFRNKLKALADKHKIPSIDRWFVKAMTKNYFTNANDMFNETFKSMEISKSIMAKMANRVQYEMFPEYLHDKSLFEPITIYEIPHDLWNGGEAEFLRQDAIKGPSGKSAIDEAYPSKVEKGLIQRTLKEVDSMKNAPPNSSERKRYEAITRIRIKREIYDTSIMDTLRELFPTDKKNPLYNPLNEHMKVMLFKQMDFGKIAYNLNSALVAQIKEDSTGSFDKKALTSTFMKKLKYSTDNYYVNSTASRSLDKTMSVFTYEDALALLSDVKLIDGKTSLRASTRSNLEKVKQLETMENKGLSDTDQYKTLLASLERDDIDRVNKIRSLVDMLNNSYDMMAKSQHVAHMLIDMDSFSTDQLIHMDDVAGMSSRPYSMEAKRNVMRFDQLLRENINFNSNIFDIMTSQTVYALKKAELAYFYRSVKDSPFIKYYKDKDGLSGVATMQKELRNDTEAYDSLHALIREKEEAGEKVGKELYDRLKMLDAKIKVRELDIAEWKEIPNALSTEDIFGLDIGDSGYLRADMWQALCEIKQSSPAKSTPLVGMMRRLFSAVKSRMFYMALRQTVNNTFQLLMAGDYRSISNWQKAYLTMLYVESRGVNRMSGIGKVAGKYARYFEDEAWVNKYLDLEAYKQLELYNGFSEGSGNPMREITDFARTSMFNVSYKDLGNTKATDRIMADIKKTYHHYFKNASTGQEVFKRFANIALGNDVFKWLSEFSWSMDRMMRLSMFMGFKQKGLSLNKSAEMMQMYMADYDSIPTKTRRALNWVFFVPNYKTQVFLLWKKMLGGAPIDNQMLKSLIITAISKAVIDTAMEQLGGWVPQKRYSMFGYRYFKEVQGGQIKATSFSEPMHEIDKWIYNGFWKQLSWQLHPAIGMIMNTAQNKNRFGQKIFNDYDPQWKKAQKFWGQILMYMYPPLDPIVKAFPNDAVPSEQELSFIDNAVNTLGLANVYFLNTDIEQNMARYNQLRNIPNRTDEENFEMQALDVKVKRASQRREIQRQILRLPEGQRETAQERFNRGKLTIQNIMEIKRGGQ